MKPVIRNATVIVLEDEPGVGGQCLLAVSADGCFFSAPILKKIMVVNLDQFDEYLKNGGHELPEQTIDILKKALDEARSRAS